MSPTLAGLLLIFRVSLKASMCPGFYPYSVQPPLIPFFWELLHRGIAGASNFFLSALKSLLGLWDEPMERFLWLCTENVHCETLSPFRTG